MSGDGSSKFPIPIDRWDSSQNLHGRFLRLSHSWFVPPLPPTWTGSEGRGLDGFLVLRMPKRYFGQPVHNRRPLFLVSKLIAENCLRWSQPLNWRIRYSCALFVISFTVLRSTTRVTTCSGRTRSGRSHLGSDSGGWYTK